MGPCHILLMPLLMLLISAGDSLLHHSNQKFSTYDKDQDSNASNCAKQYLGAFWYRYCHLTNPNGVYLWGEDDTKIYHFAIGVAWQSWKNNFDVSMKTFIMKIKVVP